MQQGDEAEHLALTATGSCRLTGSTGRPGSRAGRAEQAGRPCGPCVQQLPEGG